MPSSPPVLNNAEIAERLSTLVQLLSVKGENPNRIRAYRRAAAAIRSLGESVDQIVRTNSDLTFLSGHWNLIRGLSETGWQFSGGTSQNSAEG